MFAEELMYECLTIAHDKNYIDYLESKKGKFCEYGTIHFEIN